MPVLADFPRSQTLFGNGLGGEIKPPTSAHGFIFDSVSQRRGASAQRGGKRSFQDNCVPKQSLGTRRRQTPAVAPDVQEKTAVAEYANGVSSFSPRLSVPADYLGSIARRLINPEWVVSTAAFTPSVRRAGCNPFGVGTFVGGCPRVARRLPVNPGLSDGIPLGFFKADAKRSS
jgi:hypothetical protein